MSLHTNDLDKDEQALGTELKVNTQSADPLVSVLTPVHNGAEYLGQCIESVLAQSYSNYEYTIVNNCSTDGTLDIAHSYAKRDRRIKVVSNPAFVGAIANHNIAFRQLSSDSAYCKLVSADDWIYPDFLERLIALAEANPSVGIVQAYSISINGVRCPRLPIETKIFDGRKVCELYLLGEIEFCAAPSACLYRSSLVRSVDPFFPGSEPSADLAAWLNCLQSSDLGVVHQVLSFERIHDHATTAEVRWLSSYLLDRIEILRQYGPMFLSSQQLENRHQELLDEYYEMLATAAVNIRGGNFWTYHRRRLHGMGLPLIGMSFSKAVLSKLLDLLGNPKQTAEKLLKRINSAAHDANRYSSANVATNCALACKTPKIVSKPVPERAR